MYRTQVVEDSLVVEHSQDQAVLDIRAVTVESLVEEDIQDILGSLRTVDIRNTSLIHTLQTIQ